MLFKRRTFSSHQALFLLELSLFLLFLGAVWFALGKTASLAIVGPIVLALVAFLLIVYYGTSYRMTPLRLFMLAIRPLTLPWMREELRYITPKFRVATDTTAIEVGRTVGDIKKAAPSAEDAPTVTSQRPEGADRVDRILIGSVVSSHGVAKRAERRINTHLIVGVFVGLLGLLVWYFSFWNHQFGQGWAIIGDSLPRLTILIFIELLAGFFLRQYRISVEDFKYFWEQKQRVENVRVAYAVIAQAPNPELLQKFISEFLQIQNQTKLGTGETTTALEAMKLEENISLKALNIIGDHIEDLTKVLSKNKT